MKAYRSLFRRVRGQALDTVFAHFYAIKIDPSRADYIPANYDRPFRMVAEKTSDGYAAWQFHQPRFQHKHRMSDVPKLRNYLDYTFVRLNELEQTHPGKHFRYSADQERVCFNTGLQNKHGADLLATFVRYKERPGAPERISPDWVFKGCYAPNDLNYRSYFGTDVPEIAWYSTNSRDFIFDLTYQLQRDVFDHLFERAKERAGMPNAHDEIVRTYLRGALENLVPKIKRNYKLRFRFIASKKSVCRYCCLLFRRTIQTRYLVSLLTGEKRQGAIGSKRFSIWIRPIFLRALLHGQIENG